MKINLRKSAIAATAALSLAAASATPVHALGKNEKNFLLGAGAALLIGSIYMNNKNRTQTQQAYRTPSYSSSAARAFNSYSATERRQIQSKLKAYGYYRGTVDGSFGPQTQQAVAGYAGATLGTAKLSSMNGAFEVYDSLLY